MSSHLPYCSNCSNDHEASNTPSHDLMSSVPSADRRSHLNNVNRDKSSSNSSCTGEGSKVSSDRQQQSTTVSSSAPPVLPHFIQQHANNLLRSSFRGMDIIKSDNIASSSTRVRASRKGEMAHRNVNSGTLSNIPSEQYPYLPQLPQHVNNQRHLNPVNQFTSGINVNQVDSFSNHFIHFVLQPFALLSVNLTPTLTTRPTAIPPPMKAASTANYSTRCVTQPHSGKSRKSRVGSSNTVNAGSVVMNHSRPIKSFNNVPAKSDHNINSCNIKKSSDHMCNIPVNSDGRSSSCSSSSGSACSANVQSGASYAFDCSAGNRSHNSNRYNSNSSSNNSNRKLQSSVSLSLSISEDSQISDFIISSSPSSPSSFSSCTSLSRCTSLSHSSSLETFSLTCHSSSSVQSSTVDAVVCNSSSAAAAAVASNSLCTVNDTGTSSVPTATVGSSAGVTQLSSSLPRIIKPKRRRKKRCKKINATETVSVPPVTGDTHRKLQHHVSSSFSSSASSAPVTMSSHASLDSTATTMATTTSCKSTDDTAAAALVNNDVNCIVISHLRDKCNVNHFICFLSLTSISFLFDLRSLFAPLFSTSPVPGGGSAC